MLLKDSNPEVRTNLFKNLGSMIKVTGIISLQQSITPALKELVTDENWRIRGISAEILSTLGEQLVNKIFGFHQSRYNFSIGRAIFYRGDFENPLVTAAGSGTLGQVC